MDGTSSSLIRGYVILLVGLVGFCYFMWRWLKRSSETPTVLVIKWLVSAGLILVLFGVLVPMIVKGGEAGAFLVPVVAMVGLILGILWAPNIGGWVGDKFERLYCGGDTPPDPEPLYSAAESLRKRGHYGEALAAVTEQLAQFPLDERGHLMLADIHARDRHDLATAAQVIAQFTHKPGVPPEHIAAALQILADYHLDLGKDPESARQALEEIRTRLAQTPWAHRAEERLARLADPDNTRPTARTTPIAVPHRSTDAGLGEAHRPTSAEAPGESPDEAAARLALQVEQHPRDHEAREQLAILYADHFQDLQTAAGQVEILLAGEEATARQRVHWLNLLADLQMRHGQGYDVVRQTLERIVTLHPDGAAAAQARQRIDYLRLSLRARESASPIRMGRYETDLGLKKKE